MLFVRFDCIPQVAEELNFKAEEASKLAVFSISIGALIYCSILFFTSFGLTLEEVTSGDIIWATGHTVEYYFGKIGLWFGRNVLGWIVGTSSVGTHRIIFL
ncbi:MAG: hypothetical protein B6227_01740 [Fusobacteriia bacterium 4572_74]|nr:MAG: hypothetical protein B6227_01740 [Fusobacteriia bacterium 4572_74]